jgi:Mg-chelatase subunit ChlD
MSSSTFSAFSTSVIGGHLDEIVIAGAAGIDAEELAASEVTLVTILVDASSSIASRGLEDAVVHGYGELLAAFSNAREKEGMLVALWTFNDEARVVHAYVPVDDATRLDRSTYSPVGCTRLYDTFCDALTANVAYADRLRAAGTPTESIVIVITDGEDAGSRRTASDCRDLLRKALATEAWQAAFVGVGTDVDFRNVAKQMGFPATSVAVCEHATPASLRALFRMVSQATLAASMASPGGARGGFFGP